MAQRTALSAQLRFHIWPLGASTKSRQQAVPVEMAQLVQPPHVDGQNGRAARLRVDVADDAGPAAVGDEVDLSLDGELDQFAHVGVRGGEGDAVREGRETAVAHRHPIGKTLAAGVAQAYFWFLVDQVVGFQA